MLDYVQEVENYVLSVGNLVFSHSHTNWVRNGS